MTWLTWRQHRQQALFILLGLVALAALLVPTGRQMHGALAATGVNDCLRTLGPGDQGCGELVSAFSHRFRELRAVAVLLLVVPLLIGLFLGPPLVARELEHGTQRFVWTQGVSRLRWALVKIVLVSAFAVVAASAFALLLEWWVAPLNLVNSTRLEPGLFDMQGIVPVGYTLFAVALGILAGTYARSVLPAMALTLFLVVAVRLAVALVARPNFMTPLRRTLPVVGGPDQLQNGDWIISSALYDGNGQRLSEGAQTFCARGDAACIDKFDSSPLRGAYNVLVYQPAGRFWEFQAIETGLFVALAAVLLATAVYRIRRRLS